MLSQILVLILLILLNAFFAASEIAFISLNERKVELLAQQGDKKSLQIHKMLEQPSKFLATIQIGITLAGFLSSAFASDSFASVIAPLLHKAIPSVSTGVWTKVAIVIITVILSFFTLVFGELVPKRLAMKRYEKIAYSTVGVIRLISVITAPAVKFLTVVTNGVSKLFGVTESDEELVTEEEIKMMVDQGEEDGTIAEGEKELINAVFELNDTPVSKVMKHRSEVFALEESVTLSEALSSLAKVNYRYSRIPIYHRSIDSVVGVLHAKDLLANIHNLNLTVSAIAKPAYFTSERTRVDKVLKTLQRNKVQLAVVIDEYGGTSGIVTMEDITEELTGEVFDEFDDTTPYLVTKKGKSYLVYGNLPVEQLNEKTDLGIPEGSYDTLGGYILEQIGRIPVQGEELKLAGGRLSCSILTMSGNRIEKVLITPVE